MHQNFNTLVRVHKSHKSILTTQQYALRSFTRYEDGSEFLPMEADLCDEETEAYVTNLSYYHLVPFETDILEWGTYTTDACWWTSDAIIEEYILLNGT